jgi:REP element-mobilizing transposase RayT
MTAPRQIFQGTTYLITRRCSERRFFLRPSKRTNDIFRYALAVYAERYRIQIHAFCVLSNHHHLVLSDPHGRLPDFQRDLHALVARATNRTLGRWESFWDRDSYSAVRLVSGEDVLRKLVYTLANPVEAGLVRRGREWPGLWSDPSAIGGKATTARRPRGFFDERGNMPAEARLQLSPPPCFRNDPAFITQLGDSLREAEILAAAKLENDGRSFLGLAGVLSQSTHSCPAPGEPRRQLKPRVACRAKWKRIEALQRLKEFGRAYKAALAAWKSGVRDALFPPGTWHMRVQHAVRCASYG